MNENEIYEILGVIPSGSGDDPPRTDGDQAPAEPSGDGTDAGNVSNLDTTDNGGAEKGPAGAEDLGQDAPQEAPDGAGKPKEEPSQSPKDAGNLAGQEARWRAMAQQMAAQAVEEERARNQAEWNAFFASAGLKNSLENGKPITSLEEFRQWKTAYDRAKLEQDLKAGKLTPEMLDDMIAQKIASSDHPAVGSRSGMDQTGLKAAKQSEAPAVRSDVTKEQIEAELAEIHRLDGSVNGLEDILKLETGRAFQEAVRRGHSFLDAFKLANFDRLQSRWQNEAAQRAAQAARNSARSKEHLRPSASKGGSGSVAVPGDVMEMYRMMMPNASEAEITAHYNRIQKEMKK